MKKLTWKNDKPLICLLLATAILLSIAIWTRPRPVLPVARDWKLEHILLSSHPQQYGNLIFTPDAEELSTTNERTRIITPEQNTQIVQRLSQAICRRDTLFSSNWECNGFLITRPASKWDDLHMSLFFVSDHSEPSVRYVVLGSFSTLEDSFNLPRLNGTWATYTCSFPIEDGEQVTGDVLRILGLE